MKELLLSMGKVAIVDDEDYEILSSFKWSAWFCKGRFYAARNEWRIRKTILMHRFILDAPSGMDIDHINGDGLDNRRANLRICTRSQNLANQGSKPNNKSGLKGVSHCKQTNRWIAFISVHNKTKNLGRFNTPQEAHAAYMKAAQKYFGEFARSV